MIYCSFFQAHQQSKVGVLFMNYWFAAAPQAYRPFLQERGYEAVVKLCQSIGHTAKSKNVALFPDDTQVVQLHSLCAFAL